MIAALGTLPFLATLWLLVVLTAKVLEESGAKIAAALKGVPPLFSNESPVQPRVRTRAPYRPVRGANVEWRAAA